MSFPSPCASQSHVRYSSISIRSFVIDIVYAYPATVHLCLRASGRNDDIFSRRGASICIGRLNQNDRLKRTDVTIRCMKSPSPRRVSRITANYDVGFNSSSSPPSLPPIVFRTRAARRACPGEYFKRPEFERALRTKTSFNSLVFHGECNLETIEITVERKADCNLFSQ